MSDELDAKGRIELEVIAQDIDAAITKLGRFNEETGHTVKAATSAERSLNRVSKALRGTTQATDAAGRSSQTAASANEALRRSNESIISQRYALYDVATTYGAIAGALLLASGYAVKLGADYETAFTAVERTSTASQTALAGLRDTLVDLSTEIPVTFQDLARIATLGNQLGIDPSQIPAFTQTVARFATVTGMTVEATATAFGSLRELLNLGEGDFERLGSAIALVGRQSVATEAEIVALATRLAASATNAGFSAQEVIALSGALASLRVAPERAQGVMEVYFNRLNNALAAGGKELEVFASVAGLTVEQVRKLTREDPNAFFRAFAAGLSSLDPVTQTQALEALGLSGIRAGEVFGRVAGNLNVFDKALADANQGYIEGTELADQYTKVVDDLNSQWQLLVSSINALINDLTGGSIPGLAALVGSITDVVNGLRELAQSPAAAWVARTALLVSTLVGVFFAFRAASALATASTYALITAQESLGKTGAAGGIHGLIRALLGLRGAQTAAAAGNATVAASTQTVEVASSRASRAVLVLRNAFFALGRATLVLGLLQLLSELLFNFNGTMARVSEFAQWATGGLAGFNGAIRDTLNAAASSLGPLGSLAQSIARVYGIIATTLNLVAGLSGFSAEYYRAQEAGKQLTKSLAPLPEIADAGSVSLDNLGSSASGAAREIRTLVDYGNDLSQVFQRAFDIRFGGIQGFDTITKSWSAIRQAIAEANQEANEHRATMQSLSADRAIREYWLSVAENYGDTLRAGELRAEIAEIDADLAESAAELAKAQDRANKTLTGNSDAAIENRSEILGLVSNYQAYIATLAASGLSQDELARRTAELKNDFYAQATQLGYNQTELHQYAAAFDDVTYAIQNVPRNITVNADVNPAVTAIRELLTRINNGSYGGGSVPVSANVDDASAYNAGVRAATKIKQGIDAEMRRSGGGSFGKGPKNASNTFFIDLGWNGIGGWAEGGFTGMGGKYEPAGIVHKGEYVFDAASVRNIGLGNLAYAHKVAKRGKGYADGGYAGTGLAARTSTTANPFTQLSPYDRQLLEDIRDAIIEGQITPDKIAAISRGANTTAAGRRNA